MTEHELKCEAPICMDCPDKTTVWYAGEKICKREPMTRLQRKQHNINNLLKIGKYKFKEMAHTVDSLNLTIGK
jgi:hypothetical protein